MRVFIIGAGLVGTMVVEALHDEHEVTVVDLDQRVLKGLAQRYDVATATASAVSTRELRAAGIADADLVIACTSRDEANIVAGLLAHEAAPQARTIVRTSSAEYVDLWRDGGLTADFVVSSELETALQVAHAVGMPSARHTDTFADGQVQLLELDVREDASDEVVNRPLREAQLPGGSRVAAIIREGKALLPNGDATLRPGDRVVLVGTPDAAAEWCQAVSPKRGHVRDVVIYGAQELGAAIARTLVDKGLEIRVVEPDHDRATAVAEQLQKARVYNTTGLDDEFVQREGIPHMHAAIFAMRDDHKNLYAATALRMHGVAYTIALAHDAASTRIYEQAGIDVVVDPQAVTAEEIVRWAHDPRTRQVSMLEHDRFEILDITVRPEGKLVGMSLREMPIKDALIGAIIRDGQALFPSSDSVLQPGDRVIVFTEASRAQYVESVL